MRSWKSLPLFVSAVVGVGLVIGYLTAPGEWYSQLNKPWFNPPNWLFAPVWALLYVMIAVAGWSVWRQSGTTELRSLWSLQMALNFLWPAAFFGANSIGLALIVIFLLLPTIIVFLWRAWPINRLSALMFVPYAMWVAFASLLNLAIFVLN